MGPVALWPRPGRGEPNVLRALNRSTDTPAERPAASRVAPMVKRGDVPAPDGHFLEFRR